MPIEYPTRGFEGEMLDTLKCSSGLLGRLSPLLELEQEERIAVTKRQYTNHAFFISSDNSNLLYNFNKYSLYFGISK